MDDLLTIESQPVVTAMTFGDPPAGHDALTEALKARACEQAHRAAEAAHPGRAAPLSLLRGPACWLGYAALGWLLLAFMMPTLPGRGLARLFMPGRDVAPYSVTSFEVVWEPSRPIAGDTVTVLALARGRAPEAVEFVLLDDAFEPIERRAMSATREGYALELADLRDAVTFHVEAFGRRTRRYTITPEPLPIVPDDNEDSQTGIPDGSPVQMPQDPGDAPPSDDAGSGLARQMGRLAELVGKLSRLADQAERSGEDAATSEAIEEALGQLSGDAAALGEELDAGVPQADAGLAKALEQLAQALQSLEVAGLGPATPADSDSATQTAEQQWRDAAAQAARSDAARLARGIGEAQAAIASGHTSRPGGELPPDFRDPRATGGYDETVPSSEEGVLPDALMRQVPPRYREQTADYFRRLAQDADPTEESP
ncbi:MAG: hypothetical protein AAGA29_09770 [Planctomycetota bacterium]